MHEIKGGEGRNQLNCHQRLPRVAAVDHVDRRSESLGAIAGASGGCGDPKVGAFILRHNWICNLPDGKEKDGVSDTKRYY